jgi:hypothetical protein
MQGAPVSLEFTTSKRRNDPIEFTLDGEQYLFTPPKSAGMLLAMAGADNSEIAANSAMIRALFDWLGDGLPEEQSQRLMARLQDKEDDLDTDTLIQIIQGLQKEVAGRPTLRSAS